MENNSVAQDERQRATLEWFSTNLFSTIFPMLV